MTCTKSGISLEVTIQIERIIFNEYEDLKSERLEFYTAILHFRKNHLLRDISKSKRI